ncbi:MAG TPA: dienelactone hydrolase family protein [Azospirillaceae bacterium]|nr:dienelactone hydrolase family protein [Azospirillaceae bacterium]
MPDITITASDGGTFQAYLARPQSGQGPGLIVIQEIFGVNQVMRDLCDGFAAQGYLALCPDLFWRQQPGVQLTDKSEEEWTRARQLMAGFNEARGILDLHAALVWLSQHQDCTGKVGVIGYCLGGRLAYLMATRSRPDCSVSYYGVGLDNRLSEAAAITKPLLLHIAGQDRFVPPEAQTHIREVLSRVSQVTIHTYPDCDHAFARPGGQHYDAAAAELANRRTAEFLARHLK